MTLIYLDRSNELALEILNGLHDEFVKTREARAVLRPNERAPEKQAAEASGPGLPARAPEDLLTIPPNQRFFRP